MGEVPQYGLCRIIITGGSTAHRGLVPPLHIQPRIPEADTFKPWIKSRLKLEPFSLKLELNFPGEGLPIYSFAKHLPTPP